MIKMLRRVDKHSGVPAYVQIVNMIKSEIILGNLQRGSQLPTVRELQAIFDVNINTVLKALEKLKTEGFIEAEQGIGYFVKKEIDVDKRIVELIKECVRELKNYQLDFYTAMILFEEVWKNEKV